MPGHEIVDIDTVSSHEGFAVMQNFAVTRQQQECDALLHALSRRHPFSAFRSELNHLGLLKEWHDFKDKAYEEFAEERLTGMGIDFVNGKIVCAIPANIRIAGTEDQ